MVIKKVKKVNKLWRKLFNQHYIESKVKRKKREKNKSLKISKMLISILVQYSLKCGLGFL